MQPNNANPVMSSSQTLMTCFSLCVPVTLANDRFNSSASLQVEKFCRVRLNQAAECAKVVQEDITPGGEKPQSPGFSMLQDF